MLQKITLVNEGRRGRESSSIIGISLLQLAIHWRHLVRYEIYRIIRWRKPVRDKEGKFSRWEGKGKWLFTRQTKPFLIEEVYWYMIFVTLSFLCCKMSAYSWPVLINELYLLHWTTEHRLDGTYWLALPDDIFEDWCTDMVRERC